MKQIAAAIIYQNGKILIPTFSTPKGLFDKYQKLSFINNSSRYSNYMKNISKIDFSVIGTLSFLLA
jgi:hypothetical protein